MAKMKFGAPIGARDVNYRDICVGDHIKEISSGLICTVTNYGTCIDVAGVKHHIKDQQFTIVSKFSEAAVEEARKTAMSTAEAPVEESTEESVVTSAETPENPTEAPHWAGQMSDSIDEFRKAEKLVAELRSMGYTVSCSKELHFVAVL